MSGLARPGIRLVESALFDPQDLWPSALSRRLADVMSFTLRPGSVLADRNRVFVTIMRAGAAVLIRGVAPARGVAHVKVDERYEGRPVRGEWVGGNAAPSPRIVYYLHGSGFVASSPAIHRGIVNRVAQACDRPAFALEYRRAPEHPFPAAAEDALAGYRWLLSRGFRPQDIVVAGDSAGGGLALGLVGELHRRGLPQPAGVIALSPLVRASYELAVERDRVVRDPFWQARYAQRVLRAYIGDNDPDHPLLDVRGGVAPDLPPILIQAGGAESMAADAEAFHAAQVAVGGKCDLQIWPGQIHVFQACYRLIPEARAAMHHIGHFVAGLGTRVEPRIQVTVEVSEPVVPTTSEVVVPVAV